MCSTKTPCPIPLFSTLWVEHIEIDHAVDIKKTHRQYGPAQAPQCPIQPFQIFSKIFGDIRS